jgi:hypothetical protein
MKAILSFARSGAEHAWPLGGPQKDRKQRNPMEAQEFRTMPVPFWQICCSDTIKGARRKRLSDVCAAFAFLVPPIPRFFSRISPD